MARSLLEKVSLEVQRIVVRMWARDEDDSRSDFTYHSPTVAPSPPHRPLLLPSSLLPLSPSLPCKPSPPHLQSCLSPSLLRPRLSQPLPHPCAHTPSHAIQSPPPHTHPHPSPPPQFPISSAASVLALPAIVKTAPPAAASVVSSPAVSVVAVHAPSTVTSVLPASFAILVSTTVVSTATAACSIPSHMASPSPASVVSSPVLTPPTMPAASSDPSAISSAQSAVSLASPAAAVSALSAASAWPAVSLQSPGATTAPTSPVAAPALVLSAAVASAQSGALLVSSSISVDVTPSAKVSVTHVTSNDALPSPHATSIAQEIQEGLEPKLSNAAPQKDQQPPSRRRHRRSRRRKHHIAPRLPFHRIPAQTYALTPHAAITCSGEDLVTVAAG
ncbi:hypothetical protein F5148DRAFT_428669 [Russula earlei]|uniref:Uncharacterized protein n=1 Tax=Russula earlei TaxID=71964 RepID=A0ACC0U0G9_9AGAM|nr:hypothetical protein F5148DRAFT_428669 [Russula earlei]